jgi:uncharacterized protein DUF397
MNTPVWRKSSRSDTQGNECVEVANLTGSIGVRDSKDPDGPKLIINASTWRTFTRQIKTGATDLD